MAVDIKSLDLELKTRDKIWFVAVAIPILGVLGGALGVAGVSEQVRAIIVALLLCVAFVAWHVGIAIRRARRAAADAEHDVRHPDTDSTQYLQRRMHARPE